jgi:hypothetical protein
MAQVLAAPVLEEPLEDVPAAAAGVVVVVVVVEASVLGLLSVLDELSLELSTFLEPAPLLLYRSAYQPPPLRMKPAPPDTWRFAVACLQFGHSLSGAALMDCSASQAWPQSVQAYS